MLSYHDVYQLYDRIEHDKHAKIHAELQADRNSFATFVAKKSYTAKADGFQRMALCRSALDTLDGQGWQRSYHQRMFHDNFIRACARVFFKVDQDGTFQRAHQSILDLNGWDTLSQEVLISTPRRFGKTISVSMFAAAMVFATDAVQISIYSTCKRISQKLLQNIRKFLALIYKGLKRQPMKVVRSNMEELVMQGPGGISDIRVVNSYPCKVSVCPLPSTSCHAAASSSASRGGGARGTPSVAS